MTFSVFLQYGGQEHLDAPPVELLLAQTEDYVEYSRHGTVIKGQEKAVVRSKYEEDVLINNHTVSVCSPHHTSRYSVYKKKKCSGNADHLLDLSRNSEKSYFQL